MAGSLYQLVQSKEKEYYMKLMAAWITYRIQLYYRYYGNDNMPSYEEIYETSFNVVELTKEDEEKIYKTIDKILLKKQGLFMAHSNRDKPMYIVDCINGKL